MAWLVPLHVCRVVRPLYRVLRATFLYKLFFLFFILLGRRESGYPNAFSKKRSAFEYFSYATCIPKFEKLHSKYVQKINAQNLTTDRNIWL
jgi:hypothetical protein